MDVRDDKGALPTETDLGCTVHFFSPCYKYKPRPQSQPLVIAAHKKLELDGDLNIVYDIKQPGTYTVVGYVHLLDEKSNDTGYFKTNTIKITVQ